MGRRSRWNLGVAALFGRGGGRGSGLRSDYRCRSRVPATATVSATGVASAAIAAADGLLLVWVTVLLLSLAEKRAEALLELAHTGHHAHEVSHHHLHLELS